MGGYVQEVLEHLWPERVEAYDYEHLARAEDAGEDVGAYLKYLHHLL